MPLSTNVSLFRSFLFLFPFSLPLPLYDRFPLRLSTHTHTHTHTSSYTNTQNIQKCNLTLLEHLCNNTCGCVSFNSNGWLKGCANVSCGIAFESSTGTDTYIRGDGMPVITPDVPVAPIDDVHYPPEEDDAQTVPIVSQASTAGQWAEFSFPNGSKVNVSVGFEVQGFVLVMVINAVRENVVVIVERTFQRWGFISYLSIAQGRSKEIARLRKGTGEVHGLVMPNFNSLLENDCAYYVKTTGTANDWLGHRIMNDTEDSEATYLAAIKYMSPQRDYASIGGIIPYQKYSVSPDGRVKAADHAIYTPDNKATETGPGVLVWDPRKFLPPNIWPATNFTYMKSALLGGYLRVVIITAFEPSTNTGFEQIAFSPASDPTARLYIRLRAVEGQSPPIPPITFKYYVASVTQPAVELDASAFYLALLQEQELWNNTFAKAAVYSIPGKEGQRQIDMTYGGLVASVSLFVNLQSNYGDGEDYWSPQVNRGGSLPFQEIAVVQNLLDIGLTAMAGDRLGWWMDAYITSSGSISTGDWEISCPFQFADGFADYGEMLDIIARMIRWELAYNSINASDWVRAHIHQALLLANFSYTLRLQAKHNASTAGTPAAGLIWGPPEHDTCHDPGYYYHNQAWFVRGFLEMGKVLRDVCNSYCPPQYSQFGQTLINEGHEFLQDVIASINQTATFSRSASAVGATSARIFIPPVAKLGVAPFSSMVESVLAEYSNFRYYSELLGADILPSEWSIGLQEFRENTYGTVSGITRWSDHLDDMPSSYYLAASLREDRLTRFFLLQYGHMANYMGRGTFTATEQLPILTDANGFSRDYLWSYLEGGIDECVPSIMLTAIATRWQFVLERYDTDTLWLAKGAPRRWANSSVGTGSGGIYGIQRAATRFGLVSFSVAYSTPHSQGQEAEMVVTFMVANNTVVITPMPKFALRFRSSDARALLSSVELHGDPDVVLAGVDVVGGFVFINLTSDFKPGHEIKYSVVVAMRSP